MKRVVLALVFVLVADSMAFATWSVVAVNAETGEVVIARRRAFRRPASQTFAPVT